MIKSGEKKIIFSGIQPTGTIHIGNYLGAIKNWVELQKNPNYDCFFSVVDLHAMTIPYDAKKFQEIIYNTALDNLAAGLNPKKCTLFIQSQIKEHSELTWILDTITPLGELERMTQFKEKAEEQKKEVNAGLLTYPVLQAADILLYKTDFVPVGKDQEQHIELSRTLARKFNVRFGKVFIEPQTLIPKVGAKIMSLQDHSKKMSKSHGPESYIALFDSDDEIRRKIKTSVTDSGKEIKYDEKNKPAISNLLTIYHLFSEQPIKEIEKKYKGKGYAEFKYDLAEVIVKHLKPLREKRQKIAKNPDYVRDILEKGRIRAQKIASQTMEEIKRKVGLI
ncbi:MAG: tryptophan--tRNA ligase [Candidatus Tagabacteria bacterium]